MSKRTIHINDTLTGEAHLFAIVAATNEHRFIWSINRYNALNFKKVVAAPDSNVMPPYIYLFENQAGNVVYRLIPAVYIRKALPAKFNHVDFFLSISGIHPAADDRKLLQALKELNTVLAAFKVQQVSKSVKRLLA